VVYKRQVMFNKTSSSLHALYVLILLLAFFLH